MPRRAKKVDSNQSEIVRTLRKIPGVTVAVDHHDILVGRGQKTYWFEIKNPDEIDKNGKPYKGALKQSQVKLLDNWTGHYSIVWSVEQILNEIGLR